MLLAVHITLFIMNPAKDYESDVWGGYLLGVTIGFSILVGRAIFSSTARQEIRRDLEEHFVKFSLDKELSRNEASKKSALASQTIDVIVAKHFSGPPEPMFAKEMLDALSSTSKPEPGKKPIKKQPDFLESSESLPEDTVEKAKLILTLGIKSNLLAQFASYSHPSILSVPGYIADEALLGTTKDEMKDVLRWAIEVDPIDDNLEGYKLGYENLGRFQRGVREFDFDDHKNLLDSINDLVRSGKFSKLRDYLINNDWVTNDPKWLAIAAKERKALEKEFSQISSQRPS